MLHTYDELHCVKKNGFKFDWHAHASRSHWLIGLCVHMHEAKALVRLWIVLGDTFHAAVRAIFHGYQPTGSPAPLPYTNFHHRQKHHLTHWDKVRCIEATV